MKVHLKAFREDLGRFLSSIAEGFFSPVLIDSCSSAVDYNLESVGSNPTGVVLSIVSQAPSTVEHI